MKTILIVEDELAIADSIAYALRTDGFAPRHVSFGAAALDAMRAAAPMRRRWWCSTSACPT